MNTLNRLGVQSYCYRGIKDVPQLIAAVQATGVDRIELCGVHVDFAQREQHAGIVEQFRKGGVQIVSIGVNSISADEVQARPMFDFLKASDAGHMSVSFDINSLPTCFRVAEKLAEEYDVRLGIHNHGGYDWLGSCAALDWVFKQTSSRIGLSLDTAWAMQTGSDVIKYVETFGDRIFLLHIKDFVFDRAGRWQDVVAGSGNLDLSRLQTALDKVGYAGDVIIEYEGDVDHPVPALQACVKAVRAGMRV